MRGSVGGSPQVNLFEKFVAPEKALFDRQKLENKFKHRNTDWSIPEAFLCILIEAAVADGEFNTEELNTIMLLAERSRALKALAPDERARLNDRVNELRSSRPNALAEACETLPADMCLPVFAHCVDIVLSDGQLLQPESAFLEGLMEKLDLNPEEANRVMEVLLLKATY